VFGRVSYEPGKEILRVAQKLVLFLLAFGKWGVVNAAIMVGEVVVMEGLPVSHAGGMKVRVGRDGPYIVTGSVPLIAKKIVLDKEGMPLAWETTRRFPAKASYSLCRCGKSKNKPFCDNSHKTANFSGTETASRKPYADRSEKTVGPYLILSDVEALCTHASFCDRAGGTWKLVEKSDDPEARKTAIEEAGNCPSGRLVISDKDGNIIEPQFEPSIVVVESADGEFKGMVWVRGGIPVESADGEIYEIRNRMSLCGCGKSSNKPFCDGKHDG